MIFLRFDNEEKDVEIDVEKNLEDEVWDVTVTAKLKKTEIKDESPVSCVVKIPNSDYVKQETITYDGMKSFFLNTFSRLFFLTNCDDKCADVFLIILRKLSCVVNFRLSFDYSYNRCCFIEQHVPLVMFWYLSSRQVREK